MLNISTLFPSMETWRVKRLDSVNAISFGGLSVVNANYRGKWVGRTSALSISHYNVLYPETVTCSPGKEASSFN